jgi:hypothetical protein
MKKDRWGIQDDRSYPFFPFFGAAAIVIECDVKEGRQERKEDRMKEISLPNLSSSNDRFPQAFYSNYYESIIR